MCVMHEYEVTIMHDYKNILLCKYMCVMHEYKNVLLCKYRWLATRSHWWRGPTWTFTLIHMKMLFKFYLFYYIWCVLYRILYHGTSNYYVLLWDLNCNTHQGSLHLVWVLSTLINILTKVISLFLSCFIREYHLSHNIWSSSSL